ncbi:MAG: hypothetical protein IT262_09760 [Saprospiraceae bacterium]|nr:hypothetical protein [Saprospiraceae bacterium]
MMPIEGYSNGKNWFNLLELMVSFGIPAEEKGKIEQAVVMMKIGYR